MDEYHKIYGPFKRETDGPNKNKVIIGKWSCVEFEYLQRCAWLFTEKVDGTNIRIGWDGHKVTFAGRTDRANLPKDLVKHLETTFVEELFEQKFGAQPVTLYGEGYGAGIQKGGGLYRPDKSFVLFDVLIDGWWLYRHNVQDIAEALGCEVVPRVLSGTLHDAIDLVATGLRSEWGNFEAEGLIGVPAANLLTRAGKRIIVKIKAADFGPKAGPLSSVCDCL